MPRTVSTPRSTVNDPIELSSEGSNNLTHTSRNPISSLTMYEVFSKPMRNAEKFQFILKNIYNFYVVITKMIILYTIIITHGHHLQ